MSDREFAWLKEVDNRTRDLPTKLELMTVAFNRMTAVLAGVLITVVAAAVLIILFGRTP